ncbi:MAG: TldD/PmbA family protein [Methanomassiliicoccus sp.]|nr:TldD/PmbA family protein [Methanomassiliicoccus sp.]
MNHEEAAQRLAEMCVTEGATDATASVWEGGQCMVRFSNNEVTVVDTLRHRYAAVFVSVEGRRASSDLTELDMASLRRAARRVVSTAKASPPVQPYVPLPRGPFQYDPSLLRSPRVSLEPDDLVSRVAEAVEAGLKEGAERMAGSLIAHDGSRAFATTGGVLTSTEGGSLELSVRAFGRGNASGASVSLSATDGGLEARSAGEEAGRFARLAADPVKGTPGTRDAILGPMVMASLMNEVGRMASAFRIDTGMTFLAGREGERIASPAFSLYDDPTLADTFGSTAFDAEGLPARRNTIIEDGVFRSFLHNSTTAGKYGVGSTANAGIIAPRPFNLVASPGSGDLDSLVAEIDDGIMVTNNWYLRYQNYGEGEFSTIPRDAMFAIRKGEIAGSLSELRISENMGHLLGAMEQTTSDRRWVRWWEVPVPSLVPHALFRGVEFTGSAQ